MKNMNEQEIYILSGAVHSGKTTLLLNWAKENSNVYGILTPVMDGKRFFMDISTQKIFPMEESLNETDQLLVGKYIFSIAAFERAIQIIRDSLLNQAGWLVIDEIGPLELSGRGFCNILKEIIAHESRQKIILVIRDVKLHEVISFFNLNNYQFFQTS